jgi:hypothetical protein
LLTALLLLVLPALLTAAKRDAGPVQLLDRELFFGDPEISGAQLSPDGRSSYPSSSRWTAPEHLGEEAG